MQRNDSADNTQSLTFSTVQTTQGDQNSCLMTSQSRSRKFIKLDERPSSGSKTFVQVPAAQEEVALLGEVGVVQNDRIMYNCPVECKTCVRI